MVGCDESVTNKILISYQANIITNVYMEPFNSPIVKKTTLKLSLQHTFSVTIGWDINILFNVLFGSQFICK